MEEIKQVVDEKVKVVNREKKNQRKSRQLWVRDKNQLKNERKEGKE